MTTDPTSQGIVHRIEKTAEIIVERNRLYSTEHGALPFDLYRSPGAARPSPVVLFVSGYPDPGMTAMLGKPLKDWASYMDWARLVAASGLTGVVYANREPADVIALVQYLRVNAGALGIDPERIGVWACSGNVPTALALVAREHLACAALLYGYLLDLDGATAVVDAAARFHFAAPQIALAEFPREMPMLVVRAGRDASPGLDATLQRFVAASRQQRLPVTLIDHAEAPHAFDLLDDSARTHEVIEEILAFLVRALG